MGVPNSPWTVDGNTGQPSKAYLGITEESSSHWIALHCEAIDDAHEMKIKKQKTWL